VVEEEVFGDPSLFGDVFEGMLSDDALIRMRAADAMEKVTARYPDSLQPFPKDSWSLTSALRESG